MKSRQSIGYYWFGFEWKCIKFLVTDSISVVLFHFHSLNVVVVGVFVCISVALFHFHSLDVVVVGVFAWHGIPTLCPRIQALKKHASPGMMCVYKVGDSQSV